MSISDIKTDSLSHKAPPVDLQKTLKNKQNNELNQMVA